MIRIRFDPSSLTGVKRAEWGKLMADANSATQTVISEWEDWRRKLTEWSADPGNPPTPEPQFEPKFDTDLWKGISNWLLENVFSGKCAYCETRIRRMPADAEHFRPKGRVSVVTKSGKRKTDRAKIVDEYGAEIVHPGYFWLAYTWQNLLPTCIICNRKAKRDIFPVSKIHRGVSKLEEIEIKKLKYKEIRHSALENVYYLKPEDLDKLENRLLLNPYFDEPGKHLIFGIDGSVQPRANSPVGKYSIEIYNLDDPELDRSRSIEQFRFFQDYLDAIGRTKGDLVAKRAAADQVVTDYIANGEYVAAVMDHMEAMMREFNFLRPNV